MITTDPFKQLFLNTFKYLGHKFIVHGDINTKHLHWGSRSSNHRINSILHIKPLNYTQFTPSLIQLNDALS